ncbi:MAG: hypothetical protein VW239_00320 [Candidatus Nanopelagicales bacterium]
MTSDPTELKRVLAELDIGAGWITEQQVADAARLLREMAAERDETRGELRTERMARYAIEMDRDDARARVAKLEAALRLARESVERWDTDELAALDTIDEALKLEGES